MSKKCYITGKRPNNGYRITYSHKRNKKRQDLNLQSKKIWISHEQKYVKLRLSTKAIKLLRKKSLKKIV
uniref:Large ribosomal subunit protein bL28c n=1 Tax=Gronococcus sybilensis TaxID=3028029 RepID=A0A9Y1I2H3_9RHOD|nr:ribosomal protein L28 [Gronococcus sybilensis]